MLDEATGKWGIRVNRVELKGIDPPPSIKDSMEKQMRADREKRAVILTAEGQRQAAILTAEGNKQSVILNAEGDRESQILRAQADRESQILRAQGEAQAITNVFQAIHDGQPDQSLLAYQYLQMLPKIAEGDANKVWVIPSEITKALEGLGSSIHEVAGHPAEVRGRARTAWPTTAPPSRSSTPAPTASWRAPTRRSRTPSPRPSSAAHPGAEADAATAAADASRRATTTADGPPTPRRPHEVTPFEVVAILLAGVAAGTINTIVGSGTLITFPTLLAFGVPPVTANVSNTVGLVPGSLSGAVGYRAELAGSARGCSGSAPPRCSARAAGAVLLLVLPSEAFDAIVPALVALGVLLVVLGPRIQRWVAARAEARGGAARPRRLVGLAGGAGRRRVRRLLRRRPGRAADGHPRHRRRRHLQRHNATKNVLALARQPVAALVFIAVADVDWAVAGLIAVGSVVGGQLGATVGRRLPAAVLRGVIVAVGVTALVILLWPAGRARARRRRPASARARRTRGPAPAGATGRRRASRPRCRRR